MSITQKAITVTAEAKTKMYGEVDPALSYTVSPSLETGDTFTGSLSRAAGENVGDYAIASTLANANYDITFVADNLRITQKAITITADANQSKIYGEVDPTLTSQITTGSLVDSDVLTGSLTRAVGEDVDDYAIAIGDLSAGENYDITFVSDDLSITKAMLIATVDDENRDYGVVNPAFTFRYVGFKNGDTETDLDTAPTAMTSATVTSDAGTYAITASGGTATNYTITNVNGTLTINAILATVITNDATSKGGLFVTFNGEVTATGGESNVERGFVYSATNSIPNLTDTNVTSATGIGAFLENITNLESETSYYYSSFATNSVGTSYGAVKEFKTLDITAPAAPQITHISDYTCSGDVTMTGDNTLEISGIGERSSAIEMFLDGTSIGSTMTASSGFFTFDHTLVTLADGTYNFTATATDAATNASALSVALTITINSTDTDGDGLPDFCDADVDGNGVEDATEDCDGDGIIDSLDTDNSACEGAIKEVTSYGFSPNGDGVNDGWVVENIETYPNSLVQVFNRSGKLVFSKKAYANDWFGVSNQINNNGGSTSKLPVGPYLFIIDLGDGSKLTKGWLYINY